jgi:hypothetical protein
MVFVPKAWRDIPDRSTPINAAALIDMETRLGAYTDTGDTAARVYADAGDTSARAYADAGDVSARSYTDTQVATRAALAHAATHQDGGADALTVREAMMATGATGLAKGTFGAYRNAASSPATSVAVVFDAEQFDVSNWYDTATGRFTPQIAGYYRLSWQLMLAAVITADIYLRTVLTKNGVLEKYGVPSFQRGTSLPVASSGTAIVQANGTTDFFGVTIEQGTGGVTSLLTGVAGCYFQGHMIGRS